MFGCVCHRSPDEAVDDGDAALHSVLPMDPAPPDEPPLGVEQAIAILDAAPATPRIVRRDLRQALGARLAQDVLADRNYPPFEKSLMDGYAVRSVDLRRADARSPDTDEVEFAVIGEVAAGQWFNRRLEAGQAVAIMTGAPLPPGADAVVPIEQVRSADPTSEPVRFAAARIRVRLSDIDPTAHVTSTGSDAREGQVILHRDVTLGPAQLAAAATVGAGMLDVYDRPRVAILSTGDELVEIGFQPGPFQIRNANNILLYALLRQLGCQVVDLGSVRDRPGEIRGAIEDGMMHDALLISGGMSMGRHDHVPALLRQLGAEFKIARVRIKPGKPFVFATAPRRLIPGRVDARSYAEVTHALPPSSDGRQCLLFGLPGNPVSAFVCTLRLVARVLRRLSGLPPDGTWVDATLEQPLQANGPREFYQPAVCTSHRIVRPLQWKGSADLFTLATANALLVRPENHPAQPAGASMRVLRV